MATHKNLRKSRVLLVDDEVKILNSLSNILEEHGFDVLTASDGEEALSVIEQNNVNVVLLDLVMPSVDGITVLKKILKRKPALPVIMLTGHGTIAKAVEATKIGAFDFLEKPVESEKILISIENALEKTRLEQERSVLLQDALERYKMVGVSPAIKKIFNSIEKIAPTNARVLIEGESGVGKELIARAIHLRSHRPGGLFLVVNCAAIPEELIESELFGHEKGAFTGASQRRIGNFELASGGTIFLDEVGDMSLNLQAKVLRALDEGEIQRVGGTDIIKIDTRIIAASNKSLKQAVREKKFREDLYFRLSVINIFVPPLRERRDDIQVLIDYFLKIQAEEEKRPIPKLHSTALTALIEYPWPGNVRELKNFVEKIVVLYPDESISGEKVLSILESSSLERVQTTVPLSLAGVRKKAEKEVILIKLIANNWNYNKTAEELGISRATLFNRLKEFQIKSKNLDYPKKIV